MGELLGERTGFFQADDGGISRFLRGGVFAGGFAELLAGLGDVEDVVDDLESEADIVTEIGQGVELGGGAVGAHAAKANGAAEQGGGFPFVNVFELRSGNLFAFAFEIGDLSGNELQ